MSIEKHIHDKNYKLSGVLTYGCLVFNYNSTDKNISELDQYMFDFVDGQRCKDTYTINNVFDAKLYDSILRIVNSEKYVIKQTHISDAYKFCDYKDMRLIVPLAKWYNFLIVQYEKTISIVSKKNDYSIFILRDLIKSQLENSGGVLFHSASIIKDDNSALIIGDKGAGKSTFAFGMADAFDYRLISNDRTYLTKDNRLISFPIDIRLGKGTITHNNKLKNMIRSSPKFINEFATLKDDADKITVFPYDVNQTIPMPTHSKDKKLSCVIIPQFDKYLGTDNLYISNPTNKDYVRQVIQKNCLTPNDPIWIQSLLEQNIHSQKELKDIADAKIDHILKNVDLFMIRYRTIANNSKFIRKR